MRKLSAATRETILQSAIRLFSEREVASVSTREIARVARVSEATVFRYFPRKDEILETIMVEIAQRDFLELEHIIGLVDDPREKLLAFCRQQAVCFSRHRDLVAIFLREYLFQHRPERQLRPIAGTFLRRLRAVLREGVRKGVFRRDLDLTTAALAFHSMSYSVLMHERLSFSRRFSHAAFVRNVEDLYRLHLQAILVRS